MCALEGGESYSADCPFQLIDLDLQVDEKSADAETDGPHGCAAAARQRERLGVDCGVGEQFCELGVDPSPRIRGLP